MSAHLDAITFARPADDRTALAKIIHVEGGRIVGKEPSPNVSIFDYREAPVRDLRSLYVAVRYAAKRGEIAIRAKPNGPRGNRRMYLRNGVEPFCEVVARRWCAFDWDGLPLELQPCPNPRWSWEPDPLLEPWVGAQIALRRLPPQFRDASLFWQVSAGAGFNPGFRLRTWHWLDFPVTGNDLKTWLKPAIDGNLVDDSTLVEVQPHYLAVQVKGGADPCPRRYGFLRQARQAVPVPDIHGIKRRQEEIERERRQEKLGSSARAGGEHPAAEFLGRHGIEVVAGDYHDPQAEMDECIAAIRSASARHTAYRSAAGKVKWLCDRYELDWQQAKRDLIAAYESTLSEKERSARRTYSTEGVLGWLEGRA